MAKQVAVLGPGAAGPDTVTNVTVTGEFLAAYFPADAHVMRAELPDGRIMVLAQSASGTPRNDTAIALLKPNYPHAMAYGTVLIITPDSDDHQLTQLPAFAANRR